MYICVIIISICILSEMLFLPEDFVNGLSLTSVTIIFLICMTTLIIEHRLQNVERRISKIKRCKNKKEKTKESIKTYYISKHGITYNKCKIKNGKFYSIEKSQIAFENIEKGAKIVSVFKSIHDVKKHCLKSFTVLDGYVYNTTDNQFVFPNGLIVTLFQLQSSEYTAVSVLDFSEYTDYDLLSRLGADESGRFYIKSESELLIILKIIYNLKGKYHYENES